MPMSDPGRDRVSDPFNIGHPMPGDPFELSQRDGFRARITGVHRHFSPVNGEVYEFKRHDDGSWVSHVPNDEGGSTFSTGNGSLHDMLRLIHRSDISAEGHAAGQREHDEEWRGHYNDMMQRMGGRMETQDVWEDYANRRMSRGDDRPLQHGPN